MTAQPKLLVMVDTPDGQMQEGTAKVQGRQLVRKGEGKERDRYGARPGSGEGRLQFGQDIGFYAWLINRSTKKDYLGPVAEALVTECNDGDLMPGDPPGSGLGASKVEWAEYFFGNKTLTVDEGRKFSKLWDEFKGKELDAKDLNAAELLAAWGDPTSTMAAFSEGEAPTPFLIQGLLKMGDLAMVSGRAGKGKSSLWTALGLCVAAGIPIPDGRAPAAKGSLGAMVELGERVTHQVPVLYVNVDIQHRQPVTRRRALMRGLGIAEGVPFHVWTLMSPHLEITAADHVKALGMMVDKVRGGGPVLVIVDALTGTTNVLDQYKPEIRQVADALLLMTQERQATVVLLHHNNKGDNQYRGSPVTEERVNVTFSVDKVEPEPSVTVVTMTPDKHHDDASKETAFRLTYQNELVPVDPAEPEGEMGWVLRKAEFEEVMPGTTGAPADAKLKYAVLAALKKHGSLTVDEVVEAVNRPPKAVRVALHELKEDGRVDDTKVPGRGGKMRWEPTVDKDAPVKAEEG